MVQTLYEAMFIVDSNKAKENYEKYEALCLDSITRFGGTVLKAVKWDDRRLTYEIGKAKRGTYILVHFNAPGDAIAKIERHVQLSEDILRALVLADEDGIETTTGNSPDVEEPVFVVEDDDRSERRRRS